MCTVAAADQLGVGVIGQPSLVTSSCDAGVCTLFLLLKPISSLLFMQCISFELIAANSSVCRVYDVSLCSSACSFKTFGYS